MIKYELIQKLSKIVKRDNEGFTLIELLVVVIILGILSAIAMPNLFRQIEKSRQTEAKVVLGNINRAQQVYRFENGTFTSIANLPMAFSGKHYIYTDSGTTDSKKAVHTATPINAFKDDLKNYSSATGQTTSGVFKAVICEQNIVDGSTPPIPATVTDGDPSCTSGTTQIF